MSFRDRFRREPPSDVAVAVYQEGAKALSNFGTPVVLLADGYIAPPDLENWLTRIISGWLAEAFSRAVVEVHDFRGVRVRDHPVEVAYRYPRGGRGQFWRGTIRDWLTRGMWVHGFDKTVGRRIYRVRRIPRGQLQIPVDGTERPIWMWVRNGGRLEYLMSRDFVYGIWDPDDANEFNGISPLDNPEMRNIVRLSKAAVKYQFDGFMRSGGKGLLISDPSLANLVRFQSIEERSAYRELVQQSWEDATTGEKRGAPIVTDGIETKVTEYGVSLADIDMGYVHSFTAEMLLALVQLPPSSVGIRIDRDPTYANSRTWESVAFERGVLPRQIELADRISSTMLTEVERSSLGYRVVFRTDDAVRAKLEDRQLLERLELDRLTKGAAAVWEVRKRLEGIDPNPELEQQLQAAHMLRITGAAPTITVTDPRLGQVVAEAISLNELPELVEEEEEDTLGGRRM